MRSLRIGSRGSDLALAQSRHIARRILDKTGIEPRIEIIRTQGDRIQDVPLDQMQGKGFFTKELEEALLARKVDLAVHSLKDLPTESPPGLVIAAIAGREDPRDCLLLRPECNDDNAAVLPLGKGVVVGTSALRRKAQLRALRPDLVLVDIRGNVPTRVGKLGEEGGPGAIVIAAAGLHRLGDMLDERLAGLVRVDLDPELFVPAPGQGALAVQTREGDGELGRLLSFLHDGEAAPCVVAERRLLALLEGGCHVPLGAHAVSIEGGLLLRAFFEVDGEARRAQVTAAAPEEAAQEAFRVLSGDAA